MGANPSCQANHVVGKSCNLTAPPYRETSPCPGEVSAVFVSTVRLPNLPRPSNHASNRPTSNQYPFLKQSACRNVDVICDPRPPNHQTAHPTYRLPHYHGPHYRGPHHRYRQRGSHSRSVTSDDAEESGRALGKTTPPNGSNSSAGKSLETLSKHAASMSNSSSSTCAYGDDAGDDGNVPYGVSDGDRDYHDYDGDNDGVDKEFDWSARDTPTPEITPFPMARDPYRRYRNEPEKHPRYPRAPRPPPATLEPRLLVYRRRLPRVRLSSRYIKQRKRLNAVRLECGEDGRLKRRE